MSLALLEVTKQAIELPNDQRFKLARILLDLTDFPSQPDDDVNLAWEDEISGRILKIQSGSAKGREWDEVIKDIDSLIPA
jgi:hypothetical protein